MATTDILAALQDPLQTGMDTYAGIGAAGIGQALPGLVDPYGSAGGNALNVFGGSILAALLGRMAKNDAAEENADIVTKQAAFMGADPEARLAMVQQDPRIFAKLQTAIATNDLIQQAQDKSTLHQLEITAPFEAEKQKAQLENQIQAQIDPRVVAINDTARRDQLAAQRAASGFDDARNLANDFAKHAAIVDYKYKENNMKALAQAVKDPSGTSDFEIIRRAAQMVEPGLAVRADDQESLQGAASALGMTTAMIQNAISGKSKLDGPTRLGLMRIGQRALDSSVDSYNTVRQNFLTRAENAGFDQEVIVPYGPASPFATAYPDIAKGIALKPRVAQAAAPVAVIESPAPTAGPVPIAAAPDLATFQAQAKAAGLTMDQARAKWIEMGGQ